MYEQFCERLEAFEKEVCEVILGLVREMEHDFERGEVDWASEEETEIEIDDPDVAPVKCCVHAIVMHENGKSADLILCDMDNNRLPNRFDISNAHIDILLEVLSALEAMVDDDDDAEFTT
jgi:hypothetical protein